jgi:hypothetical protein
MLKTKDIISKITILLGLVTIVYGVFVFFNTGSQFANYKIVDGKVINYVKTTNGSNVPVIEYKVDSVLFTIVYDEKIGTFPKENRVKVRYNLKNPNEAELYESYREIGIPVSIITIGLIILIFGGTMCYFSSKSK